MTSFGLDEPMGCYDDIDHADVFVLWGNNMAEMHPVLFSRILERKRLNPKALIIDLATRTTRTSAAADFPVYQLGRSGIPRCSALAFWHRPSLPGRLSSSSSSDRFAAFSTFLSSKP